jgi:hypothetical protein
MLQAKTFRFKWKKNLCTCVMGLMEIGDIPTYGKSQKITLANVGLAIFSSMRFNFLDATFFSNCLLMVTSLPFYPKECCSNLCVSR